MHKVIGVDPGTHQTAFVLLDEGRITAHGILKNQDMMHTLRDLPLDVTVGMEIIQSFGMAVGKEVFETCYWIGRFSATVGAFPFWPVYRTEVKLHTCQTTRAKDSNIRVAMLDRWGQPGTKHAQGPTYGLCKDEWSALAIATTVSDKLKAGGQPNVLNPFSR